MATQNPGGRLVAYSGVGSRDDDWDSSDELKAYDAATGAEVGERYTRDRAHGWSAIAVGERDGRPIAAIGNFHYTRVIDLESAAELTEPHDVSGAAVAMVKDGDRFIIAAVYEDVRIWDAFTHETIR